MIPITAHQVAKLCAISWLQRSWSCFSKAMRQQTLRRRNIARKRNQCVLHPFSPSAGSPAQHQGTQGTSGKWGISRQNSAFVPQTALCPTCCFKDCKPESGFVGRSPSKSKHPLHLPRYTGVWTHRPSHQRAVAPEEAVGVSRTHSRCPMNPSMGSSCTFKSHFFPSPRKASRSHSPFSHGPVNILPVFWS